MKLSTGRMLSSEMKCMDSRPLHSNCPVVVRRIPKCVRTSHYADDAFGLVPNGTRELLHGMGNMQIRGPAFM